MLCHAMRFAEPTKIRDNFPCSRFCTNVKGNTTMARSAGGVGGPETLPAPFIPQVDL